MAGECTAGCISQGCPSHEQCDSSTGRCVSRNDCEVDEDCNPPFTVCSNGGECVEGCGTTGCPSGYGCNDQTGRCEPPETGCSTDGDCDPPGTVCDQSAAECVPGCLGAGCPEGLECDEGTGRCIESGTYCVFDSDCEPPETICDAFEETCVPGCMTSGCPEGWECDGETGRCAQQEPPCVHDGDCEPPETVCDGGECVPGCVTAGCQDGWTCNEATGRCVEGDVECVEDMQCEEGEICEDGECVEGCRHGGHCADDEVCDDGECVVHCMEAPCPSPYLCEPYSGLCEEPGDVPMGGACHDDEGEPDHGACASDYCFPGSGTCTKPCTASMQCTTQSWQCLAIEPMGARACGYNAGTGTGAPGDPCGNCKTNWCWDGMCTDDCQHSRDCPQPGYVCRVLFGEATDYKDIPVCATPAGALAGGSSCSEGAQCQSEICLAGRCADPCHTSFDCPPGDVCTLIPATNGSAVRLCVSADGPTGTEGPGAECDPSTHLPCRSLLCVELTDDVGFCTDTCATHEDCGSGMRCEIIAIDTTDDGSLDQSVPICLFR